MKTLLLLFFVFSSVNAAADVKLSCLFHEKQISISATEFRAAHLPKDELFTVSFIKSGVETKLKPLAWPVVGRTLGVATGDDDSRPSVLTDLKIKNTIYRIAAFYCSGNKSDNYDAKLVIGTHPKSGNKSLLSGEVITGSCTAKGLTELLTSDCAALK